MKNLILPSIRRLGLMPLVDRCRMYWIGLRNRKINTHFKRSHPQVSLPSDAIMYETYQLHYEKYYYDGQEVAKWLVAQLSKYRSVDNLRILDWGCGPARIVRHLPNLLSAQASIHGTDFNSHTIEWCQAHIRDVLFHTNGLHPPTRFLDATFDFIYGISVLTHLSPENHERWLVEINRIAADNAIILLTTQGEAYRSKLDHAERINFDAGNLVVRMSGKEGHRTYSAFHPKVYMMKLFSEFEILDHHLGADTGHHIEQDSWILRKK